MIEWMIYSPAQTTHMCPMYSFKQFIFQMQHTLQPAEKNFYMLENLWTKLVSNRFMEIMMNINIYNYTMCVCVCVYSDDKVI